jgi:predicted DNA-binding transcriptional regulator AlpA
VEKYKSDKVALQLAAAAHFEGARLNVDAVCAIGGIGKTKLYEEIKAGHLTPIPGLGARCTRFSAASVRAWLAAKGVAQ